MSLNWLLVADALKKAKGNSAKMKQLQTQFLAYSALQNQRNKGTGPKDLVSAWGTWGNPFGAVRKAEASSLNAIQNTVQTFRGDTASRKEEREAMLNQDAANKEAAQLAADEAEAARLAQVKLIQDRRKRGRIRGKSSTILTSPLGAIGADIQKKVLLGR